MNACVAASGSLPQASVGSIAKRSHVDRARKRRRPSCSAELTRVDQPVPARWSTAASGPQPSSANGASPTTADPPRSAAQLRRRPALSVVVAFCDTRTGTIRRS